MPDFPHKAALEGVEVIAEIPAAGKMQITTGHPPKPKFRERCNGCGLCCAVSLCDMAEKTFVGAQAPCPALEWENGRAWCGMVRHPSKHLALKFNGDEILAPLWEKAIGSEQGCGMEDEVRP